MNFGGGAGGGMPPYGGPPPYGSQMPYVGGAPMYSPYCMPMQQMAPGMGMPPSNPSLYPASGQGPLGNAPVRIGANGLYEAPEPEGPEEHEAAEFMRLNPGEAVKYDEYWAEASCGEEQVSGKDARMVLSRASNVSKTQLRLIWEIADHRREGYLDRAQFLIALRLIALAQRGAEISVKGLRNFVGIQLIPSISPRPPTSAQEVPAPKAGVPSSEANTHEKGIGWTVGNDVLARYDKFFASLDAHATGFLDGATGVAFFGKSGLPRPVLKQIWQLADISRDGKLNRDEFRVAMHMVAELRSGRCGVTDLPKVLDPEGPLWLRSEEEAATFSQTQRATLQAQQAHLSPHQQVGEDTESLGPKASIQERSPMQQLIPGDDSLSISMRPSPPPAADGDLLGGAVPLQSSDLSPATVPLSPRRTHRESGEDAAALREKLRAEQQEALRVQRELELMKAEMRKLRLDKEKSMSMTREQELRDQSTEVEQMRKAYHDLLAAKARAEEDASRARREASQLKQESMRMPDGHASPTPSPRRQPLQDYTGNLSPASPRPKQSKPESASVSGEHVSPAHSPRKQAEHGESIWSESSTKPSRQSSSPLANATETGSALKLPSASVSPTLNTLQGGDHGAAASADDFFGGKAPPIRAPFVSSQNSSSMPTGTSNKRTGAAPARPARLISDDSMSESDDDDFWGSSGAGSKPKLGNSSIHSKGATSDSAAKDGGLGNDLDEWAF